MRFLLKTVEQHNYVAVVKDEEHSVCVAVVFCPKFKDTIFQMLDEFLIPTFGLLDVTQHIRYFYLRAFFKAVEEVLKISFVVCYLPCHVTKIRKVSIYRNFFERHGTPCPYNRGGEFTRMGHTIRGDLRIWNIQSGGMGACGEMIKNAKKTINIVLENLLVYF